MRSYLSGSEPLGGPGSLIYSDTQSCLGGHVRRPEIMCHEHYLQNRTTSPTWSVYRDRESAKSERFCAFELCNVMGIRESIVTVFLWHDSNSSCDNANQKRDDLRNVYVVNVYKKMVIRCGFSVRFYRKLFTYERMINGEAVEFCVHRMSRYCVEIFRRWLDYSNARWRITETLMWAIIRQVGSG